MSRIGKQPITIPEGVSLDKSSSNEVIVKGKLGELSLQVTEPISVRVEDAIVTLERPNDQKESRAKHGLYRALIQNMIVGVSSGYTKELELVGVGYRASNKGQLLELSLGFSHNILLEICTEVKVETISEKGKNPIVRLSSHDKQLIGMVAAKIRSMRKPEPYKGKGIKFVGEEIRRKAGKTAG
ncbi:MAG: 50S ribosomal protein L6 [Flavobacteriales bacterium]|jgi:large subunit ribosomal protein L6|nr:50S ribosomal protein L6 [Flavobacteriales bacterium]|tara:strand:- start:192 stop:743 length:552 start_codon:yes stop_codon:yes gene_type:complete